MTKALLVLSFFPILAAEGVLCLVIIFFGAGGISPGWEYLLALLAAALVAPAAPILAGAYLVPRHPVIAVVAAWLPAIAICLYYLDWWWPLYFGK